MDILVPTLAAFVRYGAAKAEAEAEAKPEPKQAVTALSKYPLSPQFPCHLTSFSLLF